MGAVDEVLSSALGVTGDTSESSDDLEAESEEDENESKSVRKKKNKIKGTYSAHIMWVCNSHEGGIFQSSSFSLSESESYDGGEYPVDIWLMLSAYIRPEDVCRFSLICKNAWIVTCTAAFWTRLYRRSAGFVSPNLTFCHC